MNKQINDLEFKKFTLDENGQVAVRCIIQNHADEKVKADSTDSTAGYLSDKVDGDTLEVDTATHKMKVKDGVFASSSHNHSWDEIDKTGSKLSDIDNVDTTGVTDGQVLGYDGTTNKWKPINQSGGGGGSTTFIGLTDTPSSYTGQAGKLLAVNTTENGIEYTDINIADEKVKADSTDSTAGYLADKVDGDTLEVDTTNHTVRVSPNFSNKLKFFTIVDASGAGDYTTITDAIADGKTNIFVRNGVYNEGDITVTTDGTNIIGESVEGVKIVTPNGKDGLRIYANNCIVKNITIDSETNNAEACLVIGDGQEKGNPNPDIGNGNIVENCIFKGGDHTFTIYIAGPSYSTGNPALTGFENNQLSKGNKIINCKMYSSRNGDAFSFALQRDGEFRNNYCEGRIAFYVCRDSSCNGNIINNSAGHGIFIGGPVYNSSISYNVITNTTEAGIKLQNQLEHTPLLEGQAIRGNTIIGNTFNNIGGIGIEISGQDGHEIQYNNISNNTIEGTGDHGIYLHYAYKNKIQNNIIKDVKQSASSSRGSGIYMVVGVTDNIIQDNYIYSENMHTGISNREDNECPRNIIRGNTILGTNTERTVWVQSSDWIIENNRIEGGYYAGIRVLDGNNTIIKNNKLYNNTREHNNSYYEIWIEGSATNTLIEGNYIKGGESAPLAGIGITSSDVHDTKICNNYGPLGNNISDNGTNTYICNKADKVDGATAENLASLTSDGNLADSGYKPSDFALSSHNHNWGDISKSGSKLSDIEDVPVYTGQAGKLLAVKNTEDGTEWVPVEAVSGTDELVKADSGDSTAGYLADKVDGDTLEVDTATHKMKVKSGVFAPATHNHDSRYYTKTETDNLLSNKEDKANKVSSWQTTPDDTHYPTEKLVKDNLDDLQTNKANKDLSNVDDTDFLNKIKTVDGSGSGIDADLLDGHNSDYFAVDTDVVHKSGDETIDGVKQFIDRLEIVRADSDYKVMRFRNHNENTAWDISMRIDKSFEVRSTTDITSGHWDMRFHINPDNGNVGINTTNPSEKLEVNGNIKGNEGFILDNNTDTGVAYFDFRRKGTVKGNLAINSDNGDILEINSASSNNVSIANGGGNVGIGTTSPTEKLEVNGNVRINGAAVVYNNFYDGTWRKSTLAIADPSGNGKVKIGFSDSANGYGIGGIAAERDFDDADNNFVAITGRDKTLAIFKQSGNVGIGTTNPSSKLTVETPGDQDGIITRNLATGIGLINGNATPWIDFKGGYLSIGNNDNIGTRSSHGKQFIIYKDGDIETTTTGKGLILKGEDGNRYRLKVNSNGELELESI